MSKSLSNQHRLRVLVVDNNTDVRELHRELLELWGYMAIVAEGLGQILLQDAISKAKTWRCQLALVDVHLLDDYDHADRSGLDLIEQLRPARSIMVSGSDDKRLAIDALVKKSAVHFVGKEEGPEMLKQAIEDTLQRYRLGPGHLKVIWPITPRGIEQSIYYLAPFIEGIEIYHIEELLAQLFPNAQKLYLDPVVADSIADQRTSNLRRRSRVYLAQIDDGFSRFVVKIAHADKIQIDNDGYEDYVNNQLEGNFYPVREGNIILHWDLGGIVYRRVGAPALHDADPLRSFREFFISEASNDVIIQPLKHLFIQQWGRYYSQISTYRERNILESYDTHWKNNALGCKLNSWSAYTELLSFKGLNGHFPDPRRWLFEHQQELQRINLREAITHGDLHADNLFVNSQHAWPIDFERTGPGHVLRDVVELVQDTLTRLVPYRDQLITPDLHQCYLLYTAVCLSIQIGLIPLKSIPQSLSQADIYVRGIFFAHDMQKIVCEVMKCIEIREYYWALLINNLFVAELIGESDYRWEPTMLFASILCARLEQINTHTSYLWPLAGWPSIVWLNIQELHAFKDKQGHAQTNIYGDVHGSILSGDFSGDIQAK